MAILIKKQGVAIPENVDPKEIFKVLKLATKKFIKETAPSILFSMGHRRGADPGAVNSHTETKDGHYPDEISCNEFALLSAMRAFDKADKSFFVQAFDGLSTIIQGAIAFFGLAPKMLLVQIHHDMSVPENHKLFNKHRVSIYYGSQRGLRAASLIRDRVLEKSSAFDIVLLHHTSSPRNKLGFIAKTLHTALIIEYGFVSQPSSILQKNWDTVNEVLTSIEREDYE